MTRPTCAICADDIQPKERATREPLGKGGAMVLVCEACSTEPPREVRSERSYEPSGGLPSLEDTTAGARRAMGDTEYERLIDLEIKWGQRPVLTSPTEVMLRQHHHESTRRNRTRASQSRVKSSRLRKLY